jgi:hypothetical protein
MIERFGSAIGREISLQDPWELADLGRKSAVIRIADTLNTRHLGYRTLGLMRNLPLRMFLVF